MLNFFSDGSVKYVIVITVVSLVFIFGVRMIDSYIDSRIEAQAAVSTVEAEKQEKERVEEQSEVAKQEFLDLMTQVEKSRAESSKLIEELKKDWEAQLNENPHKWIDNTNNATLDQLRRGQEILDSLYSTTVDL